MSSVKQTDLQRILNIPRTVDKDVSELAEDLTQLFKTPEGTQALRDVQALSLFWASQQGGLLADAPVGTGKTLITFLLPAVMEAKRPLLLVPASLMRKLEHEIREYSENWQLPKFFARSYETLSRDKDAKGNSRLLQELSPDLIVCDEAHFLANPKAGCTRKVARYMKDNPTTKFCALSATFLRGSLNDVRHLSAWALGYESPLPLKWSTGEEWARSVDPGTPLEDRIKKATRSGIDQLGSTRDEDWPRKLIGERIRSTPGVVSSGTNYHGPLLIQEQSIDPPESCVDAIAAAKEGIRPDGEEVLKIVTKDGEVHSPIAVWQLVQELCCGYWTRWDPEPPREWRDARREWQQFVASQLAGVSMYDTPEAVRYAVESGAPVGQSELARWRAVKSTFRPNVAVDWIDRDAPVVLHAAEWLQQKPGRLVWTRRLEVAKRVAELACCTAYGAGQGYGDKPMIEAADGASAVLTIAANSRGRNLQKWNENLILQTPANNADNEQMIGRTHRHGQTKPVHVTYVQADESHRKALQKARDDAAFAASIQTLTPKLLLG